MNGSLVVVIDDPNWTPFGEMARPLGHLLGDGRKASPNGEEPATHLYLHTNAPETTVAIMMGWADPEPTEDYTVAEIKAAIAQVAVSLEGIAREDWDSFDEENPRPAPLWGAAHVDVVLARLELQKVAGPALI
ncbi:hypothetical protein [Roseibium alexandrii]|uniref:hypothetical protein n=1 Tax=Roseibium alexandrii TaxID=388408 RepID=UPI003753D2AA